MTRMQGGGQRLPHLDRIQQSFGRHDIFGVRAHTGARANAAARNLGARAYASGDAVVLGEAGTDVHTVAHEAAHVIQQRSGVALKGGVGEVGDRYERHADAVADAVVAGRSAEALLDRHAGSGTRTAAIQLDGDDEDQPAPLEDRYRTHQFVVTEDYETFEAAVLGWLSQHVMSRTEVPQEGGERTPIRRERALVEASNLERLHARLAANTPGEPVTLRARLIPGQYRYEQVRFSTPGLVALAERTIEGRAPDTPATANAFNSSRDSAPRPLSAPGTKFAWRTALHSRPSRRGRVVGRLTLRPNDTFNKCTR